MDLIFWALAVVGAIAIVLIVVMLVGFAFEKESTYIAPPIKVMMTFVGDNKIFTTGAFPGSSKLFSSENEAYEYKILIETNSNEGSIKSNQSQKWHEISPYTKEEL